MIRRYALQGLFFFIILGIVGTIIRLKMAMPFLPELQSKYLLHAHSHIAVLGWTNVVFVAIIMFFTFKQKVMEGMTLKVYFWALLFVNTVIVISFMAQGYAFFSILFSTLSLVLSAWFLVIYFRSQDKTPNRSALHRFFTTGVIFYMLSAAGLVMIAIHMATKMEGKDLFNTGVYFYLHSQYNGWMIFILIASFYAYLQKRGVAFSEKAIKWQWALLTISFLPTFVPQVHFFHFPSWVVGIGVIGTVLTFIAIVMFLQTTWKPMLQLIEPKWLRILYSYTMIALFVKVVMEVGGSLPFLVEMIHTNRQVVIAYLHLTLLAMISGYLFFAIYQYLLPKDGNGRFVSLLFITTTFLMVFTLFFDGLLQWLNIRSNGIWINGWLALISVFVTISGIIVFIHAIQNKMEKK